jgi:hypothetical protein
VTNGEIRYRRSPSVLARTVGPEVLLSAPDDQAIRSLSGTASTVWLLLEEPRTAAELAGMAAEIYDVSPPAILGDIQGLLAALEERGLADRVS